MAHPCAFRTTASSLIVFFGLVLALFGAAVPSFALSPACAAFAVEDAARPTPLSGLWFDFLQRLGAPTPASGPRRSAEDDLRIAWQTIAEPGLSDRQLFARWYEREQSQPFGPVGFGGRRQPLLAYSDAARAFVLNNATWRHFRNHEMRLALNMAEALYGPLLARERYPELRPSIAMRLYGPDELQFWNEAFTNQPLARRMPFRPGLYANLPATDSLPIGNQWRALISTRDGRGFLSARLLGPEREELASALSAYDAGSRALTLAERSGGSEPASPSFLRLAGAEDMIPGQGTPTLVALHLLEMRAAGIAPGSLRSMRTRLWVSPTMAYELYRFPEIMDFVRAHPGEPLSSELVARRLFQTSFGRMMASIAEQSGHRIVATRIGAVSMRPGTTNADSQIPLGSRPNGDVIFGVGPSTPMPIYMPIELALAPVAR